jgi:hypothetical protein
MKRQRMALADDAADVDGHAGLDAGERLLLGNDLVLSH